MNRKRLLLLKRRFKAFIQNPGNVELDMNSWFVNWNYRYWRADPNKVLREAIKGNNYCGTTCCLLGFATTIPSFQRQGLHLRTQREAEALGREPGVPTLKVPGDELRGNAYDVGAHFFEISWQASRHLFDPAAYNRPNDRDSLGIMPEAVLRHIDDVLEGRSK